MTFKSMTRSEREQAQRDDYLVRRRRAERSDIGDLFLLLSGSIADTQRANLKHSVGGDFTSCFSRGITPVR